MDIFGCSVYSLIRLCLKQSIMGKYFAEQKHYSATGWAESGGRSTCPVIPRARECLDDARSTRDLETVAADRASRELLCECQIDTLGGSA